MKKIKCVLFGLAVFLVTVLPVKAQEQNFLYEIKSDNTVIIQGFKGEVPTHLVIPDYLDGMEVSEIEDRAFLYCDEIESVELPSKLKIMGISAFSECDNLKQIYIPEGTKIICSGAFDGCDNLEYVKIPASVTNINYRGPFTDCPKLETAGPVGGGYDIEYAWKESIPDFTFFRCKSLKSIVFPDTLKVIGEAAFQECEGLLGVSFPESLEKIGYIAFVNCNSITEAVLPDGCTTIENSAFFSCDNLEYVKLPYYWKGNIYREPFEKCPKLITAGPLGGNYNIEYVWDREIPTAAFKGCDYLEEILVPKTVEKIGEEAFANCNNLTIYGYLNSVAESHAKENDIPFYALDASPYRDVKSSDWFFKAVRFVTDKGLMNGVNATDFAPNATLTRAQFAVILYRMENTPESNYQKVFIDVPEDKWFSEAVIWANQEGIIQGYPDGSFRPDNNISREQMAVMMMRYGAMKGYDMSKRASFSGFKDAGRVSDYAEEAMMWAVGNGIINGKEKNKAMYLEPLGNTSRAECATIMMRFSNEYE